MINSLKGSIFVLFAVSALCGCDSESPTKGIKPPKDLIHFELVGPVKTAHTYTDYTHIQMPEGEYRQVSEKNTFNKRGMATSHISNYLDSNAPNAKPNVNNTTFHYDNQGRLEKQLSITDLNSTTELTYLYRDGENLPYQSVGKSGDYSYSNTYSYDERGNTIAVNTVDMDFNDLGSTQSEFNQKNQRIIYKALADANIIYTATITYTEKGHKATETIDQNSESSTKTYQYLEFDPQGNWIERKVTANNAEGYMLETREISYY